eukprot:280134-Chlamydomonas_euryale.AAC.1
MPEGAEGNAGPREDCRDPRQGVAGEMTEPNPGEAFSGSNSVVLFSLATSLYAWKFWLACIPVVRLEAFCHRPLRSPKGARADLAPFESGDERRPRRLGSPARYRGWVLLCYSQALSSSSA